jgi:glyoxylate/hydroxypyruvate reductase A
MPVKSPVLVDVKFDPKIIATALKTAFLDRGSINWTDPAQRDRDLTGVDYALLWKPDHDLFQRAPNLKVIFSAGAGVDHLMGQKGLPDVPVVRFVDRSLTVRMTEWIVLQCLLHLRDVLGHLRNQRERIWGKQVSPEARDVTVGIMGLGVLGMDAAEKLNTLGFNVIGWSRSEKRIEGMETFAAGEMDAFLSKTDILVGLLPLTPETKGIYNASLFGKLRNGGALGRPVFINAGRGGSQVQADIVAAVEANVLGGVSLDVFEVEPLSSDDPLWGLENVVLTPHDAAVSEEYSLMRHVEAQIVRFERGEALEYLVDRARGY